MTTTGYAYLATPYSRYQGGIQAAFEMAARLAARLMRAGVPVFCPITHSHPIAVHGGLDPLDAALWSDADAPLLAAASVLVVYQAPGWTESVGIRQEIAASAAAGKPVVFWPWLTEPPAELVAHFSTRGRRPAHG